MKNWETIQTPRLLVIDDNPGIHRDFDLVFQNGVLNSELEADEDRLYGSSNLKNEPLSSYELDHALSGVEGVEKVRLALESDRPYQVAFVDIRMPGIDGVETIGRIWRIDSHIQTVICTAYADYCWEELARRLGQTDRLLGIKKPFDNIEVKQLASTLARKWVLSGQASMKLEQMELLVAQRTQKVLALQKSEMERTRELDRIKVRFLTNAAREFRTPLTLILGPLEQMRTTGKADLLQQELVYRNAEKLMRLIDQSLDLGRLEEGDSKPAPSRNDLVAFLRGAVRIFQPIAGQQKVELIFQSDRPEHIAWFDAVKLEKIIHNLLSHSLKRTPENGRVVVQALFVPGSVQILVEDTGLVIASENLPFAFKLFAQAEPPVPGDDATGVSLALTQELVLLLGGTISVESPVGIAEKGSGTRFTLVLSLPQKPEGDTASAPIPPEAGESPSIPTNLECTASASEQGLILLIGDDRDLGLYIKQGLGSDYRTVQTPDSEQGLIQARETVPDLLIVDIAQHGAEGIGLCRRLKSDEMASHIPIILLTTHTAEDYQVKALEAGADDFLTKPFKLPLLKARVDNLLESRRKLQKHFLSETSLQPRELAVNQVDAQFLERTITIIEKHMADFEFDVDALSEKLAISRRQLFRKLKAVADCTPNAFVRNLRLKRAAQLLKESDMTVTDITYAVGFADLKHFRTVFRENYGVLPGEYLKRSTEENHPPCDNETENG